MNTMMRYVGQPTRLGRFGIVKSGDTIRLAECEAKTLAGDERFQPVVSLDTNRKEPLDPIEVGRLAHLDCENIYARSVEIELQSKQRDELRKMVKDITGSEPSRYTSPESIRTMILSKLIEMNVPTEQTNTNNGNAEPILHGGPGPKRNPKHRP